MPVQDQKEFPEHKPRTRSASPTAWRLVNFANNRTSDEWEEGLSSAETDQRAVHFGPEGRMEIEGGDKVVDNRERKMQEKVCRVP